MITVSPLPKSPQLSHSCGFPDAVKAYSKILEAEAQATRNEESDNIMFARIAGFLILELSAQCQTFGTQPCSKVVQDVLSPSQDPVNGGNDSVFGVGKYYLHHLICGCTSDPLSYCMTLIWFEVRKSPMPSSMPSSRCSPPRYGSLEDMTAAFLDAPEKDFETAARKVRAQYTAHPHYGFHDVAGSCS